MERKEIGTKFYNLHNYIKDLLFFPPEKLRSPPTDPTSYPISSLCSSFSKQIFALQGLFKHVSVMVWKTFFCSWRTQ